MTPDVVASFRLIAIAKLWRGYFTGESSVGRKRASALTTDRTGLCPVHGAKETGLTPLMGFASRAAMPPEERHRRQCPLLRKESLRLSDRNGREAAIDGVSATSRITREKGCYRVLTLTIDRLRLSWASVAKSQTFGAGVMSTAIASRTVGDRR